jgi:ribosomal protein S18 acetylase RimI-like enzyme
MKVIDAYWEKRNLGVNCKEIIVCKSDGLIVNDLISRVESLINSYPNDYFVFKVNYFDHDLFKELSNLKFLVSEMSHEIMLKLNHFELTKEHLKWDKRLGYEKIAKAELYDVVHEINKGIFDTDRIALSKRFGTRQSSKRYSNWLENEFSNGSDIYELIYKNKPVGFFAIKSLNDDVSDVFLAGLYSNYKNSGLGLGLMLKSIQELKLRECEYYKTHVSSNNLSVLRLYLSLGFMINENYYVFTR